VFVKKIGQNVPNSVLSELIPHNFFPWKKWITNFGDFYIYLCTYVIFKKLSRDNDRPIALSSLGTEGIGSYK
jgi:hypothetical protein